MAPHSADSRAISWFSAEVDAMRHATLAILIVLGVAAPSAAQGQSWEVSGLVGYTPSADLDRRAPELNQLDIRGGLTWGAQAARLFTPHWAAEVLFTQQASAQEIGTAAGTADLFTMTVRQLQGSAVYDFGRPGARLRPFAFAGLGATFFSAEDLQSETKLLVSFGGGVKYLPWDGFGFRAHFRYKPTMLNDEDAGDFCDPFGFCQGTLHQIEVVAGAVVRF
jgi:opacity protein-like surface antigen